MSKSSNGTRSFQRQELDYRDKALKMYPWVCGRCGREFVHSNLRELTVHHIDHNHNNNPADGSNWELLCLFCHDNEHNKFQDYINHGGSSEDKDTPARHSPFVDLKTLLQKK